jgi:hypothetical protein
MVSAATPIDEIANTHVNIIYTLIENKTLLKSRGHNTKQTVFDIKNIQVMICCQG